MIGNRFAGMPSEHSRLAGIFCWWIDELPGGVGAAFFQDDVHIQAADAEGVDGRTAGLPAAGSGQGKACCGTKNGTWSHLIAGF